MSKNASIQRSWYLSYMDRMSLRLLEYNELNKMMLSLDVGKMLRIQEDSSYVTSARYVVITSIVLEYGNIVLLFIYPANTRV